MPFPSLPTSSQSLLHAAVPCTNKEHFSNPDVQETSLSKFQVPFSQEMQGPPPLFPRFKVLPGWVAGESDSYYILCALCFCREPILYLYALKHQPHCRQWNHSLLSKMLLFLHQIFFRHGRKALHLIVLQVFLARTSGRSPRDLITFQILDQVSTR